MQGKMSTDGAAERRHELERKKQKLAEMRENRRRAEDERRRQILSPNNTTQINGGSRQTLSTAEIQNILADVGIAPEPNISMSPQRGSDAQVENGVSPLTAKAMTSESRLVSLEFTQPQTITIAEKDMASYCKTTQTDDEKFSVGEFSLGSQEFDYDEDMLPTHKQHFDFDESPTEDLAKLLPCFAFGNRHSEEKKDIEEEPIQKMPDLSEGEKAQILSSNSFQTFFEYSSKVIERALAENVDIFVDYGVDTEAKETYSGERISFARSFVDPKATEGRDVISIVFSDQHPELMAVAYDTNDEIPTDPAGVVAVWNIKFKKDTPEYVFHSQSRLTSVSFARFHSNLVMAGCYSGQICMWDNRVHNKKTPVNKSPLSTCAHTHPVYALQVIGSHNAHNLVSISTDGKMCSWNVDNLTQPVDTKELQARSGSKQIPCLCMSFHNNDVNNFVIGSEDGNVYAVSRHGTTASGQAVAQEHQLFEGHTAACCGISCHRASGQIDMSHLFLTASYDWTVKLWSTKDPQLRYSFESHSELVYDVAWSPVHPAVFASVDADGNLFVWNLNENIEGPVCKIVVDNEGAVPVQCRKVLFSNNGQLIVVGNSNGTVYLYELHDSFYNIKAEEWSKFNRVLADMKAAVEEAEELSETMSRLGGAGVGSNTTASAVAALTAGGASPRQNNWP